jgi:hypothetical protein
MDKQASERTIKLQRTALEKCRDVENGLHAQLVGWPAGPLRIDLLIVVNSGVSVGIGEVLDEHQKQPDRASSAYGASGNAECGLESRE